MFKVKIEDMGETYQVAITDSGFILAEGWMWYAITNKLRENADNETFKGREGFLYLLSTLFDKVITSEGEYQKPMWEKVE